LREVERKKKRFYIPGQDEMERTRLEGRREEEEEGYICRGLAGHRILTFKQEREGKLVT
jgi:hypothetical protein